MDNNLETYIKQIVNGLNCSEIEKSEIAEEIQDHLLLLKNDYIEQGFSDQDASQKALEIFGDEKKLKEGFQFSLFPHYKLFRIAIWTGFCLYSFVLLWHLLFIRLIDRIINFGDRNIYFWYQESDSFFNLEVWKLNSNIIPFHNTFGYIMGSDRFNLDIILHNTVGNILIFVPLGVLLPILSKKYSTFSKVFVSGFKITFTIEILQFFLQIGQFDIDDIILNTLGTIIGYSFIRLLIITPIFTKWKFAKRMIN